MCVVLCISLSIDMILINDFCSLIWKNQLKNMNPMNQKKGQSHIQMNQENEWNVICPICMCVCVHQWFWILNIFHSILFNISINQLKKYEFCFNFFFDHYHPVIVLLLILWFFLSFYFISLSIESNRIYQKFFLKS